jgi:hypothetical protein
MKTIFSLLFGLAAVSSLVLASPVEREENVADATYECGQWDTTDDGQYIVYTDAWGEDK